MTRKKQTQKEKLGAKANAFRAFAKIFKEDAERKYEEQKTLAVVCEGLAEVCDMLVKNYEKKK